MNRVTYPLAALALLAGFAGTAPADEPSLLPPRAHCALATSGSGREQSGYVWAGPWTPDADPAYPVADVTIRCLIRLTYDGNPVGQVAQAQSAPTPFVGVLPPSPVAFAMPDAPAYNLEVCTEVTVHRNGRPPEPPRQYDADHDPTNGAQCDPATRHNPDDGDIVIYTTPEDEKGDICGYSADPQDPAADPYEVCVPWGSVGLPGPATAG
jgi:hypothetical protein